MAFFQIRLQIMRWRLLLATAALIPASWAVSCYDCVGRDCMGNFCEGDYCVLSQFRPRWGSIEFGKPRVVKGCMTGTLLRKDVKSHCEVAEDDEEEIFTCFCKGKDNCNGGRAVAKLETEPVQIIRCLCTGEHCDGGKTCFGELCSYVYNHKTKETERGCVNASIPLVERRSVGSCMSPPITGAMHHSIAMKPDDLLMTESCVCGTDFCNTEKPKTTVPERMTCPAGVSVNIKGSKKSSMNTTCEGEYCFKVDIKSELGFMKEYTAQGCASFTGDDELAEELNPAGCAKFESEQLFVEACYQTDDNAAGRARAKQKVRESKKGKGKKPTKWQEDEEEEEEEEQEEADLPKKEKVEEKEEEPEKETETKKEEKEEEEATPKSFIFEKPTEAPIPDESNTTMITVFILIMLCIVVSGAVWKFELHKKLFRSSYDTVAGG